MKQTNPTIERIYAFVADYIARQQRSPTVREIAAGCEVAVSTVVHHLNTLEGQGRIVRAWYKSRSIRLQGQPVLTDDMTEEVLAVIVEAITQDGLAPTQREIAVACHLSKASVQLHLARLQAQGRIVCGSGHRGIRLVVG